MQSPTEPFEGIPLLNLFDVYNERKQPDTALTNLFFINLELDECGRFVRGVRSEVGTYIKMDIALPEEDWCLYDLKTQLSKCNSVSIAVIYKGRGNRPKRIGADSYKTKTLISSKFNKS